MAEIVNLRRARKAKTREAAEEKAAENRAKFGTPKATRKLTEAKADLADTRLSGHRIDAPKPQK